MNIILEMLNMEGLRFVEFASPMLIQSSILILILLAADFLLRKKVRATFRYWIWMLVLIKLILPVSLYSPLSLGSWFGEKIEYSNIAQEDTERRVAKSENIIDFKSEIQDLRPTEPRVESSESVTSDTHTIITNPLQASPKHVVTEKPVKLSWQAVAFLIWIAITATLGLVLLKRTVFIKELVTKASDIDIYQNNSFSPNDVLNHCCVYLGLKKQIPLKISPDATSPVVCGLLRPVILLPQNLITSLSPSQLKAIFFHELAHIRRGDLWVNLLQTLLQIAYSYNPLLWLANSIIRRTREQAVDEMVLVAMGKDAREYPETLLNVAKLAFKRPALSLRLIGVVESKDALSDRIKHMLNHPIPKSAKLGILGLIIIILAAAILVPMGKKSNLDYFVDTTKGYIRCDSDISELGRILINMSYMYGFKQEFASSTGFGSDESPVKYSTTNYIIPDNKELSIEAVAEKNQPLIIQIDLEPGALYSLDEITTELARQLGIFSKAASLINKSETSMSIQLLGVSEHRGESNQWWKPDGNLLKERPYGTIKGDRTFVYNNKEKAYEFVVRLDGDNTDIVKWQTEPSDGSYMTSYPETKDNKLQKDLRVLVTTIPAEHKSCDLEINTESWFTLTKVKENQHSYSFGDFTARVIPPKNEDGKYVVRVQETEKEFDNRYKRRYVIKLKDSAELVNLESFTKQTSYNEGQLCPNETIYTLSTDLQLENIEYIAGQFGFEKTYKFKNVSLAAQHKTNVKISSSGLGMPSFIYADMNKPPVPRLTELSTGIVKGQKLLFFHSEHPQTLWQRLNKDKQYNPKWYFRINGIDNPLRISGQHAHSRYEIIEAFGFPFDLKDKDKQWSDGDYSLSVVVKDTVWLDPKGKRHYYKELATDPIEFKIQDGSFLSKTGQPIPKEKADQKTLEEKSATESSSTSQPAPIIGYDVKLNFADPSIRDGSFHSQQSVAFVLSFQQIEGMLAGKGIDFISTGQNIWSVIVDHNSLTISEGNVGQKIITESWPSEDKKFEKVVTLPLEYSGNNYQCPVYIELQHREHDFPIGNYWFCAYISGRLPSGSGGRIFEIVNLDQQMEFRLKGDGTDKRDAVLGIDINGDGKINPSTSSGEQFSLYEPFTIDSKTYRVAEVDPYLPRVVFREVASESKTNTSASGQSVKPKLTIKSHEENGANKEAEALMGKFQQALRDSDWSKALSFCSDNVKSNAAEYESLEKYFTEVVPVEKIKVLIEVIVSGWSGLDNMRGSYQCFLRISQPDSVPALKWEPTISWQWHLNKTDSGWEVDFKQIPLNEWIEQETNRQKSEMEQSLERERILKEGLKLTLIPLRDSFVIGKPMEFRFELKNISDSPIEYWSSQFTFFNDPMTIIDPNGSQVKYIAGLVQTGEAPTTIDPNQTIVLEEKYDVTSQYLITSPGAYTFQFTGYGFTVVKSNVVKMEVELGQISNGDLVLQKLIEIAPKDWEITKNKIPDNGITIAMIGDYGRKATSEGPTGVILLVNPSKSYLEAIDNEAEFLGHSKWGDVYINSLNAESLWPDYKEQIVQFLRIETAENSIKQNEEKAKSFTTLLPNGGTIELVGVRKKSLPDQPWYSPDGLQKLDSSDEIFSHLSSTSGIVNAAGTQTYEFFIHCDLPSNKIGKVVKNKWSFEPEKGIPVAFSTSFHIGQHYFTASSAFPETLNKINLTFNVSNGPWKAIAKNDGIKEKEISVTHRGQKQNIILGEIVEKDGSVFIEVKHQIKEMAAQVIIFEKNNNIRYPFDNILDYADADGNILVTKCQFDGMTKEQVGHYEFQVQPIDIVTFKDISLKNEFYTNPQITTTSITDKTPIAKMSQGDINAPEIQPLHSKLMEME